MIFEKIFVFLLANSEKSCTFAPAFEKKERSLIHGENGPVVQFG